MCSGDIRTAAARKQAECCLPPYLAADFIVHTLWTVNSKREIEKGCNDPLFEKEEVSFANVFSRFIHSVV
jgi:hypothetical protein